MELLVHGLGGELTVQQYSDEPALKYADIQTGGLRANLKQAIQRVKGAHGPEEFYSRLKQDAQFREAAERLLSWSLFGEQSWREFALTDDVMKFIDIPDWDELVLAWHLPILQYLGRNPRTTRDRLGLCSIFPCRPGDQVSIAPTQWGVVHSFAVQLRRQPGSRYYGDLAPVAHGDFTVTKDKLLVLGVRAGSYEQNKISLVPAGSASWPSYEASRSQEESQELNVKMDDFVRPPRLAGIYHYQQRLMSVSVAELSLTSEQVYERWQTAKDKYEHKEIFFYPVEAELNPKLICQHVREAYGICAIWSSVALPALKVGAAYYFEDIERLQGSFTNEQEIFRYV